MKLQLRNKPMFVSLGSEIDLNKFSQMSTNAKIDELNKPNNHIYYEVKDISSAKELTQKFIKEFNLGSSNWNGGRVVDENFNFIAKVSYNGRVWDNEDWKMANEIDL